MSTVEIHGGHSSPKSAIPATEGKKPLTTSFFFPPMTDNDAKPASRKPSFFKVLFPGFSNQLKLPRCFVQQHITKEDVKAGNATLSGPDGNVWNAALHKNQQGMYLSGDEWCACTQALKLEVGYFLLFYYEGSMLFSLKVFDLSTCEKPYPAKSKAAKRTETCRNGHRFEIISQGLGSPITSYCKDCRCNRFEAIISKNNLKNYYMRIPLQFIMLAGFKKKHNRDLTLEGPNGRSWTVNFRYEREEGKMKHSHMRKGFRHFIVDNQLKRGDTCVFELEAGEKDMMHVQVVKA